MTDASQPSPEGSRQGLIVGMAVGLVVALSIAIALGTVAANRSAEITELEGEIEAAQVEIETLSSEIDDKEALLSDLAADYDTCQLIAESYREVLGHVSEATSYLADGDYDGYNDKILDAMLASPSAPDCP